MLEEVWPETVTFQSLPKSESVWESSRFCIDHKADSQKREEAKVQLVYVQHLFCLKNNIEAIIGIMPPGIWRAVFTRQGWKPQFLGEVCRFNDGSKGIAGKLQISEAILKRIREKSMLVDRVKIIGNMDLKKGMIGEIV